LPSGDWIKEMNDELFWFIDAHDDDDLSDGAWWAVLEDAVRYWNKEHGTELDENDTVHEYLRLQERKQKSLP